MKKLLRSPQLLISLFGFIILNLAILSSAYVFTHQENILIWALIISVYFTLFSYFIIKKIIKLSVIDPMNESERKSKSFKDIIDNSLNEIYIFHPENLHFTYVNRGAILNTGYSFEEMKAMTPMDIKPTYDKENFMKRIEPLLSKEKEQVAFETIHRRKDGSEYDIDIRLQLMDVEGEERLVAIINDITDRNKALRDKQHFYEVSTHDHLTKVYNRQKFDELFKKELERFNRYGSPLALILLDIDYFKDINDSHGHQVGDTVLQRLAEHIENALRDSDIFARWGGEEFVILMPHTDLETAMLKAEHLRSKIQALHIGDLEPVTCSFGVVEVFRTDTILSAFNRVDKVLYRAKNGGKNRVCGI